MMHTLKPRSLHRPARYLPPLAGLLGLFLSLSVGAAEPARALPAEVIKVEPQSIERRFEAVGSLAANEAVVIRPEQAGRVDAIHFQEGQPVKKGELLFSLDDSIYQAELRQAEARARLSQTEYQRADQLWNKRLTAEHERDKSLAQLRIDQAQVQLARTRLEKMTIKAPFNGLAGLRQVSTGDLVSTGQSLVQLVDLDRIKVEFRVPERYLADLQEGQAVEVVVDAFPEERFRGEIYALAPQLDESGRSLAVRARLDNPEGRLRPGLFARVSVILETRPAALMVPEEAIVPRNKAFFVYKVVDGKVEMAPVSLGLRRQGQVEVTQGVQTGDVVVTAGQLKLRPGAPVTPLFKDAAATVSAGGA